MRNRIKLIAEGALLLNALIWGGTFVIVKSALTDSSPMMFVAVRFTISTLILLPFAYKSLSGLSKRSVMDGFNLGVLLLVGFVLQTIGLKYTTAIKSAFITGTFVVFTPIFQTIIEKKFPSLANIAGILFVIVGIIFLSSGEDSVFEIFFEIGASFNFGDFLTLLCAVFYALYIVYLDIISRRNEFKYLAFSQIAVTAVLGFAAAFTFSAFELEGIQFQLTDNLILALAYTSILATVITLLLQTRYQKEVTPTRAGLIFSMEPIFAAVFAYIVLTEVLSYLGIIGCIFIFTGVLISELLTKD
ncbi:MAG TPA: DMT family transporter [Ignavibacteriaceae bacterium]|nr:DMT family transporter [Ignavibacteriaceae bacterium]